MLRSSSRLRRAARAPDEHPAVVVQNQCGAARNCSVAALELLAAEFASSELLEFTRAARKLLDSCSELQQSSSRAAR